MLIITASIFKRRTQDFSLKTYSTPDWGFEVYEFLCDDFKWIISLEDVVVTYIETN